jgi:hypothetical protein
MKDERDYKKRKLSASQEGRGIKIGATGSPGSLIHEALGKSGAEEWDEVHLYVVNSSPSVVTLTLEWGGTTSPDDLIEVNIGAGLGLVKVLEGLLLHNQRPLRAYASTANVLMIHGYVHRHER